MGRRDALSSGAELDANTVKRGVADQDKAVIVAHELTAAIEALAVMVEAAAVSFLANRRVLHTYTLRLVLTLLKPNSADKMQCV